MASTFSIPRLYAIVDTSCFAQVQEMYSFARELVDAGVTLLQYRNKTGDAREMLEQARELRKAVGSRARLIMNDRADLCLLAGYDGVHVGQDDLSSEAVRKLIGPKLWLGVSTHNPSQIAEAAKTSADYVAIGPIFATASKLNPDPVVGLEGVRQARSLTSKPLVAIGGITRGHALEVIEAGADCVAVIADLVSNPRQSAGDFLRILR
jgi:thiamine-phosphate pyrophosphorylase